MGGRAGGRVLEGAVQGGKLWCTAHAPAPRREHRPRGVGGAAGRRGGAVQELRRVSFAHLATCYPLHGVLMMNSCILPCLF